MSIKIFTKGDFPVGIFAGHGENRAGKGPPDFGIVSE
jgi:hypothetical protein